MHQCANGWRAAPPQPPPKTCTQRLLPHKKKKATRKRFRGLKAKKIVGHASNLDSGLQGLWSGCKVCKRVAGAAPPNPLCFFKDRNLRQEGKLPAFLSCENMHTRASSTQEEESHTKSNLPARHVERLQGVQMGAGCPLQPLRFQRQTSRPQEANIESHVFSDRPCCSRSRGFHTRKRLPHENASGAFTERVSGKLNLKFWVRVNPKLQSQVGVGVRGNSNPNLRFWAGVNPNSNLNMDEAQGENKSQMKSSNKLEQG